MVAVKTLLDELKPHLAMLGWVEAEKDSKKPLPGQWKAYSPPVRFRAWVRRGGDGEGGDIDFPVSLALRSHHRYALISLSSSGDDIPAHASMPEDVEGMWAQPEGVSSNDGQIWMPDNGWWMTHDPVRLAVAGPGLIDALAELVKSDLVVYGEWGNDN